MEAEATTDEEVHVNFMMRRMMKRLRKQKQKQCTKLIEENF